MNSYAQLCIVIHTYHYIFALLKAYCTLKVGRWSPCPVLQQEARVFTPLSNGEGMGVGLFLWLLEDGARRPPSYYDLPRQSHEFFTFHINIPHPTMISQAIHSPP